MTANGFALADIYQDLPDGIETKFKNPEKQRAFERLQKLVKGKTPKELEILASLHYLKQIKTSDDEIRRIVKEKRKEFTSEQVDKMWEESKKCKLL